MRTGWPDADSRAAWNVCACLVGTTLTLAAVLALPAGPPQVGKLALAVEHVTALAEGHPGGKGSTVWSSVTADDKLGRGAGFKGGYAVFHNVAWEDGAIGFASKDDQAELPAVARGGRVDFCEPPCVSNVTIHIRNAAQRKINDPFKQCRMWVDKPAVLFHIRFAPNFYHFMCQGVAGILYVLQDCSLLPRHLARLLRSGADSDGSSCLIAPSDDVLLVAMDKTQLQVPWRYMMDAISSDQRAWSLLRGHCFRTLVVIKTMRLAFAGGSVDSGRAAEEARFKFFGQLAFRAALTDKAREQTRQSRETRAALVHEGCQANNLPGAPLQPGMQWRSGRNLPRIMWASRRGYTRDVLNEEDIFAFIRDNYNVELVNLTSAGHLYDTMQTLHTTDVFMGMHGAGMANIMWLPPGVTVLQLFPYGWQLPSGEVLREGLYSNMTLFKRGNYLRWVNPHPHNAFFRRQGKGLEQWKEHPDESIKRPSSAKPSRAWISQDTVVNMDSFAPVLEEAMRMAGVPKCSSVTL